MNAGVAGPLPAPQGPSTDVLVVGAGPAGLAAAVAAADAGLRVMLLDESPVAGGQYLAAYSAAAGEHLDSSHQHLSTSQPSGGSGNGAGLSPTRAERFGHALLGRLSAGAVDWRPGTLVWSLGAEADPAPACGLLSVAIYAHGATEHLSAGAVILAAGAREGFVPFPGWTLPGVMSAGAAQLLAKRHGLKPGRRVLIAGSGPLLLPVAVRLATPDGAGAPGTRVVGVLEAAHLPAWLRCGASLLAGVAAAADRDRLGEAVRYLAALARARVPYRFGRAVTAALGDGRLEAVTVARTDALGRPIPGTAETIPADALCIGFGLVPNVELAQLAGAASLFDPARGGWVPETDAFLETSVPGLFVAGETAGVAGAEAALSQGRLAALAAACRLGRVSQADLQRERDGSARERAAALRFGALINTLFAPPSGCQAVITDDTLVCRCEEVAAGEVRAAIAAGAVTLDALKTRTRVGQGPCQGRTCGPILARLIAAEMGTAPEAAGRFGVRPPVKPVPFAALASTVPASPARDLRPAREAGR